MQLARRRLRVARYSISALALSAFAAFGIAVRDAHPATHTTTTSPAAAVTETDDSSSSDSYGSAVISPAPQTAAPQVQSGGS
jgi:hypothetical protein